jgi:GNAT superfamily N-acetyltransferase
MLAAVDVEGALAGLAYFNLIPGARGMAASLWYLATVPTARNRGHGAWLYGEVVRRVRATGAHVLFLEVEIPELADDPAGRALAERRLGFYRRLGCRRLLGIEYLQYVGWHQEPLPMYLFVHAFDDRPAGAVFELAEAAFDGWIRSTGKLALE